MPHDDLPVSATEGPAEGDEWEGPWGAISSVAHSVENLCVQIDEERGKTCIHYFPYRTIARWYWQIDEPETLEVHLGLVQLTVSGVGRRRLADALQTGQLGRLQYNSNTVSNAATRIMAITIETNRD
jgi:hypothetical protein